MRLCTKFNVCAYSQTTVGQAIAIQVTFMKRRLHVTNLSLENNFPTLRLNASVVIGVKCACEIQMQQCEIQILKTPANFPSSS